MLVATSVAVSCVALIARANAAQLVGSVTLAPTSGGLPRGPAVATFGMPFKAGELPRGATLQASLRGSPVELQVDPKRRHRDGSLRHAVLSLTLKKIEETDVRLDLAAAGPNDAEASAGFRSPPPTLLPPDFDATLTLRFPNGNLVTASARRMIEAAPEEGNGKPSFWLRGPVVTEWLVSGAPLDARGIPDPDLAVQFQVRAYPSAGVVRVSVVVENCWDRWAGNVGYDAEVRLGKDAAAGPVWSRTGVDHLPLSRWRKVFWWPKPPVEALPAWDPSYLPSTLAVPNYDPSVKVSEGVLAEVANRWQRSPQEVLEPGTVALYMPRTGGREDIGPLPTWTARYLLSMDSRVRAQMVGNGELAASWPIHVRSLKTGRILTLDERPDFWILERGADHPVYRPDRKPRPNPPKFAYEPDIAHLPALAYVPYLVTGDFFFCEELVFWANYCLLNQWPTPREGAKGLVYGNQVRAQAWALRDIADAAWIVPDKIPEQGYSDARVRHNVTFYNRAFYGPPERSSMGWWGELNPGDNKMAGGKSRIWFTCPWQNEFLAWSFGHLVERGYADAARARDYLLRNTVGRYTNAAEFPPEAGAPYYLACARKGNDGKLDYFPDWRTVFRETWNSPEGWRQPDWLTGGKPAVWDDYGSSYLFIARGAIVAGVDGGTPGAAEALRWMDTNMRNYARTTAVDPTWAFVPREAVWPKNP
jgi:hypothetical protein